MNKKIEVIEDNAGGITIQNTATKAVAEFDDRGSPAAYEALKAVLEGADMSDWDTEESGFISAEDLAKHTPGVALRLWDEVQIREHVGDMEEIRWRRDQTGNGYVMRADYKGFELETDVERTWLHVRHPALDGDTVFFKIVEGVLEHTNQTGDDFCGDWADEDWAAVERSLK